MPHRRWAAESQQEAQELGTQMQSQDQLTHADAHPPTPRGARGASGPFQASPPLSVGTHHRASTPGAFRASQVLKWPLVQSSFSETPVQART